jgi:putative transposase
MAKLKRRPMGRAMPFIKGAFSYRLKKDFGHLGEVWQRGFSELRMEDGLVHSLGTFPYCFTYLAERKLAEASKENL